jgi:hypothetical protein
MDFVKQLFYLQSADITIDIRLGFDKESLIIEGYDTGPKVEQLRGDFDYEYQLTVKEGELDKLYRLNGIEPGQKPGLMDALSGKFNGNQAFSLFRTYLTENEVKFDAFL